MQKKEDIKNFLTIIKNDDAKENLFSNEIVEWSNRWLTKRKGIF